jgi:hypothetical protein
MPDGEQQYHERAQPSAGQVQEAQPVGQRQRLGKARQEDAEDGHGEHEADRGQQPSDRVLRPFHASSAPTVAKAPMNTIEVTQSSRLT